MENVGAGPANFSSIENDTPSDIEMYELQYEPLLYETDSELALHWSISTVEADWDDNVFHREGREKD